MSAGSGLSKVSFSPVAGWVNPSSRACKAWRGKAEIARQGAMGGLGLGNDEEPARVLVETMHDARPAHSADPGEAGTAMRQQRVNQGALWIARRGMHHQAGRLVDDDQVLVLETDR